MNLFKYGKFRSAAGLSLDWKVECDALSWADWACIARVSVPYIPPFRYAVGVPSGGMSLAASMQSYGVSDAPRWLICDDVWTTGKSMQEFAKELAPDGNWIGLVAFSRTPELPKNVRAFMTAGMP